MVAVTGVSVALLATNEAILPVPLAARPIEGVLFTQLNTILLPPPPLVELVKFIAVVASPLHSSWLVTAFTVAVGFTVIVNINGVPMQLTTPLVNIGVTVIVATFGALVVLIAVNVAMLPLPLAAIPIEASLFVQLYVIVPPVALLLKLMAAVDEPLHKTWLPTIFTVMAGCTVIVNVVAVPIQLTPLLVYVGVTVILATNGAVPLLVAVKAGIFPVPLAGSPMEGSVFTQSYTIVLAGKPVLGLAKLITLVSEL
jgi:hypothetical protein